MYKLLLATDRREIQDVFSSIESWESMGYRAPRVVTSAEGAIACLKSHHVDALAYFLPKAQEEMLYMHLQQFYPNLPVFQASWEKRDQVAVLNELRALLNRTHADFSNDNFGEADMMQLCRHEFLRALLSGQVHHKQEVLSKLRLLRSRMDPEKACVVLDMELPSGPEFMAGRWHYGSERLEVALRNFFGAELSGLRMVISAVAPHQVRLLACPMLGEAPQGGEDESMTGRVVEHADEAILQVREYLDLDMQIVNIRVLSSIVDLAQED